VKREIMIISQSLIKDRSRPLIVQEEFRHFGNRENGGGKSFDLAIRKILIHETPTCFGPLDHGIIGIVRFRDSKFWHFGSGGVRVGSLAKSQHAKLRRAFFIGVQSQPVVAWR
jgi:hypothetical protein